MSILETIDKRVDARVQLCSKDSKIDEGTEEVKAPAQIVLQERPLIRRPADDVKDIHSEQCFGHVFALDVSGRFGAFGVRRLSAGTWLAGVTRCY